jgi:hypothetical protein
MLKKVFVIISPALLLTFACANNTPGNEKTTAVLADNTAAPSNAEIDKRVVGGWKILAHGEDKNHNNEVDPSEAEPLEKNLGGVFDYILFKKDGTCKYDFNLGIETTWSAKKIDGKDNIFIYQTNLPSGISEEEKNKMAHTFRIVTIDNKIMKVNVAHHGIYLRIYQRDGI